MAHFDLKIDFAISQKRLMRSGWFFFHRKFVIFPHNLNFSFLGSGFTWVWPGCETAESILTIQKFLFSGVFWMSTRTSSDVWSFCEVWVKLHLSRNRSRPRPDWSHRYIPNYNSSTDSWTQNGWTNAKKIFFSANKRKAKAAQIFFMMIRWAVDFKWPFNS